MVYCSVLTCNMQKGKTMKMSSSPAANVVTFHKFPKIPPKRNKWIHATGKHHFVPNTSSVICSIHFAEECFRPVTGHQRRYLVEGAVPTLHLPVEPVVEEPDTTPATGIKLTITIRAMVTRVYYFLKREYEYLKARLEDVDLSPLADIMQRTATATGIAPHTVKCVIEAEQRPKRPQLIPIVKRAKRTDNQAVERQLELRGSHITTMNVEIIEDDRSEQLELRGSHITTMNVEIIEDDRSDGQGVIRNAENTVQDQPTHTLTHREGVICNTETLAQDQPTLTPKLEGVICHSEEKMVADPPTQIQKYRKTYAAGPRPAPRGLAPRRPAAARCPTPPRPESPPANWGNPRCEIEPGAVLYRLLPSFSTDMPFRYNVADEESEPPLAPDYMSQKHEKMDSDVVVVTEPADEACSKKHDKLDSDVEIVIDARDPAYSDSSSEDRLYISDSTEAPVHSEPEIRTELSNNNKNCGDRFVNFKTQLLNRFQYECN